MQAYIIGGIGDSKQKPIKIWTCHCHSQLLFSVETIYKVFAMVAMSRKDWHKPSPKILAFSLGMLFGKLFAFLDSH